ncbi:RagB/SusD family nutrient uptake outer membrane protein [Ochrovirga pacifica]|uniref:RagB/SusD family nutrient uptake outer membrane protein n=1 Tax=Ochrovirga pacifica TaxID=1042376 RepID=UPI0002559D84|nr:RagB/SusD family nutrient uptake outer membrane protein [Ochrovirga pacifica]
MNLYKTVIKSIKLSCLVLFVGMASCEDDYLEIDAYGSPLLNNFYKTPTDAEQGLNAAYSPLREMYGVENFLAANSNDLIFGDIGTDDILKGGARVNDGPQLFEKETYTLQTSNNSVTAIWAVNYKGILYANLVLQKVPDIEFEDTSKKEEILAEAHFLRAYYYFDLVNSFGGVPLITEPQEPGSYAVPRATKEQIYELIEEDLKVAINVLPSRFDRGNASFGHADKGAALGLMMRVSLYQNKMNQVKTYGEQFLLIPGYALEPDFSKIFSPEGEWGTGSVFEINFSTNTSKMGTLIGRMLTPRSKGGIGFGQIKEDLRNEYEINDPRLDASFYNVPGGYGTEWYNRKYAWAPYSEYQKPNVGGAGNSDMNIRAIRLADVYLMYAEAIYDTDPLTAIEYVNKVRTRARGNELPTVVPDLPLTLSGQALLDAIYHERRVEFAGEGYRYHDLIRTGRAEAILGPLGFQADKNEIMPIPFDQVQLSQGVLDQNSY